MAIALVAGLALPAAGMADGVGMQAPAAVRAAGERFLKMQAAGLPGRVTVEAQAPRSTLPACAALEAFQNPGARRTGRTTVGVRCLAPQAWTVYLPAQVHVVGRYVVLRNAVPADHTLGPADVDLREGDLGGLPADVLLDTDGVAGYRTVGALAAGAPLRQGLLRAPRVVQQGQTTRLVLNGPGFSVASEGQALANAARGETVRVKTRSGQVISGVAQDGQQVLVAF
jgi:flagella basal body P-ring formation protein FlgA